MPVVLRLYLSDQSWSSTPRFAPKHGPISTGRSCGWKASAGLGIRHTGYCSNIWLRHDGTLKKPHHHVHCVYIYILFMFPRTALPLSIYHPPPGAEADTARSTQLRSSSITSPTGGLGMLPVLFPAQGSFPAPSISVSSDFFSVSHSQEGKEKLEDTSLSEAIRSHFPLGTAATRRNNLPSYCHLAAASFSCSLQQPPLLL